MPSRSTTQPGTVHQIKITLKDAKPPIWRRVLIPSHFGLDKVHTVLNIAMGWTDSHLHEFVVQGESYGMPDPYTVGPAGGPFNEKKVTLMEVMPAARMKGIYNYDFGDDWRHELLVEKILLAEEDGVYPLCLDGKRACPPEDCGGMWGYEDLLRILKDPKHEEYEQWLEWAGGPIDPEAFDLCQVNAQLKRLQRKPASKKAKR